MEVENRLPCARADVDDDPVIVQPGDPRRVGDELEHSLRLLGRKCADVAKPVDEPLGQHQQMSVGLRANVADRDEPFSRMHMLALAHELAEETVGG